MEQFAKIINGYIDNISFEKDNGIELSRLDMVKVNQGYEIHINGETITYSKGIRYEEYLERKKQEADKIKSEQKATEIINLLGATDKIDAIIKQINILTIAVATGDNTEVVKNLKGITNILKTK